MWVFGGFFWFCLKKNGGVVFVFVCGGDGCWVFFCLVVFVEFFVFGVECCDKVEFVGGVVGIGVYINK